MKTAIDDLQYQVRTLFSQIGAVNSDSGPADSNLHSSPALLGSQPGTPRYPRFHGPTSPVFNIGVAKHTLKSFGITSSEEDAARAPNGPSPTGTPPPVRAMPPRGAPEAKDPLYSIDKDEATRLVHFWRDNVMIMYPIVNAEQVLKHLSLLYSFLQAANRSGLLLSTTPGADTISDDETITLKLILANASTLESGGSSEIGLRFYENVAGCIEALTMKPPTMKSIEHLALAVSRVPVRKSTNALVALLLPPRRRRYGLEVAWTSRPHVFRTGPASPRIISLDALDQCRALPRRRPVLESFCFG
jgi:hypothetical protein